MDKKFWVKCLCSLIVVVIGFLSAFLIFYISLQIDQTYQQTMEEAIASRSDLTVSRSLAILSMIVEFATGVPFIIAVVVSDLILRKKHTVKSIMIVTMIESALFMLVMIFGFNAFAYSNQMYSLIPAREMAYDIMIMFVRFSTCVPAGIILLISFIILLVSLGKEKRTQVKQAA